MKILKANSLFLVIFFTGIAGCGSDDSGGDANGEVGKTFDDFFADVILGAGDSARDCGLVGVGENKVEVNTCAAEAFMDGQAFYAIYELQGVDSQVAGAISFDTQSLTYWVYDSNPAPDGGTEPDGPVGVVSSQKCEDPEFSGSVDSYHTDVFRCAE